MASYKSSPSSASALTRKWTYDVFLSFRGEDTRNNFVDHLYAALDQRGILVFKDDKALHKGKPISSELLEAIEKSRFAVVVFSKNYADSSWCLDELLKIMECQDQMGQIVLPVFYHIDPSHVRGQKRDFDTAFKKHKDKYRGEIEKVNMWRKALASAASLAGWHVTETGNGSESAIITEIVGKILKGIQPCGIEKNLIGIKSRVDELYSYLDMDTTEEVRMIGILGMGGIGKTTIAQALFQRIANNFEGSSFVKDVRRKSSSAEDICSLQDKILREILVSTDGFNIDHPETGADRIQKRLSNKKVLLVLDDVDNVEQIEFLVESHEWFGPGSRVIITTRNEHLLSDADATYKPDFLLMNEAVELFCRHAFRKSSPPEGYEELSYRAIRYASCLPLALKVLGSFLRGRPVGVWESALNRLDKTLNDKIFETLKLSFDGLHISEKQIFLDIACFFKGKEEEYVTRVLDSFGFDPVIGISVLTEKSLITVSNKRLDMHDLIQQMGWQIVCESFPDTRLWKLDQVHALIKGNKIPNVIEAIMLMDGEYHVKDYSAKLGLNADVFARMKNLRVLDIDRKFTSTQPTFLPDELRWLCWHKYPFVFLPLADMCKLVGLEMARGDIKHLWKGRKILPNLKFIHLKRLSSLTSFPDVSGAPNIERLVVSDCYGLVEVHESLGSHRRLVYLDMNGCSELKHLPSRLEMESLETLILSGCKSLQRFPKVSRCMLKLSQINLSSCNAITELPSSIRYLSNLSFLNLTNCSHLQNINSICESKYLKCLHLHNCMNLIFSPKSLRNMKTLEELSLGLTNTKNLEELGLPFIDDMQRPRKSVGFHNFPRLPSLRKLNLSCRQIEEKSFPENVDAFSSLEELYLNGNSKLVQLPAMISHLSRLKRLELNECSRLESLCALPSSIQVLKANDCISLKRIGDLSKECKWLYKIWLHHSQKLLEDEENERYLDKLLQQFFVKKCAAVNHRLSITVPGSKIPSWMNGEKHGCRIALKLPFKWNTQIMGFVVCGVFNRKWRSQHAFPRIIFRILSDGKVIPESEVHCVTNASEIPRNGNVWITYIPLDFFQQMYKDLQPEDWSVIEGNLDMTVMLTDGSQSVKCGAHVIYKEDVQQITTCISDYGNVVHAIDEDLGFDEIIYRNTYVHEEKSDEKSLMPLRSRTSKRRSTKSVAAEFRCTCDIYSQRMAVTCACGCPAIILTSSTSINPGCQFWSCPKSGSECPFIGWVDPTIFGTSMDTMLRFRNDVQVSTKEDVLETRNHIIILLSCLVFFLIMHFSRY